MKSNINSLLDFDKSFVSTNLIGVDEVGRGCLSGDVYAAAVYYAELPEKAVFAKQINDSKKLSIAKREQLAVEIKKNSHWAIASASVQEINDIGILNATFLAMKRAIADLDHSMNLLKQQNTLILVDGNLLIRDFSYKQQFIKQGDSTSFHIASASIIAKVARDDYMNELSAKHLQYGWEKNKGYGTKSHMHAISEHGVTPYHRKLFVRKFM